MKTLNIFIRRQHINSNSSITCTGFRTVNIRREGERERVRTHVYMCTIVQSLEVSHLHPHLPHSVEVTEAHRCAWLLHGCEGFELRLSGLRDTFPLQYHPSSPNSVLGWIKQKPGSFSKLHSESSKRKHPILMLKKKIRAPEKQSDLPTKPRSPGLRISR